MAIYAIKCQVSGIAGKMRASRLLSIQMLLQTRGRLSASVLAGMLEVSVRTLYRDVDQLAAAGVPIIADRGRDGGFRLLAGWKTTLTGLTPAESQAVFLSGLAGPARELGLGEPLSAARLKLLTALPENWRGEAQRISSRFHLDPVDWYREAAPAPWLATVADAVWSGRLLQMHYESWQATVRRTVLPLGLVLKGGVWYFVAEAAASLRTYRVSNVQSACLLEAAARRPRAFDLAAYWELSVRRFEGELYQGQASVLADTEGLRQLRNLGSAVARALAGAPRSRRADGRVRVSIPVETAEHAVGQLLALAPHVEVVRPAALRRAIGARLRQAAALYGAGAAPRR
jgi:predicted DNA-binding transcriptional regulator YafY